MTSSPSSRARTATGGGASARPRPRRLSGRVTTSAGRCGPSARRSSTAAAKSEVPRETVRIARQAGLRHAERRGPGFLAERAHGLLALIPRRAIEDQHAVEVVHLVLDHARLEPGRLDEDLLPVLVVRPHPHVDRALDLDE